MTLIEQMAKINYESAWIRLQKEEPGAWSAFRDGRIADMSACLDALLNSPLLTQAAKDELYSALHQDIV